MDLQTREKGITKTGIDHMNNPIIISFKIIFAFFIPSSTLFPYLFTCSGYLFFFFSITSENSSSGCVFL